MRSFLVILFAMIGVSIACSGYKSAGSQPLANDNVQAQPSASTNTAAAQEKSPCTLTLAGAPDINGIRLGMTPDEVLALFPGSKDDAEVRADVSKPPGQFGVSSFLIRPEKYESKDKFAGISQITFTLLDGRVSSFYVGYNGPEYSHVDKFVAKFVEGTNLPAADQWEAYVGLDNSLKILKCTEVEIRVFAGGKGGNLNYVLMKDLLAEKKLKDRRAKARAAATPKP
jgi:hypothetical protein